MFEKQLKKLVNIKNFLKKDNNFAVLLLYLVFCLLFLFFLISYGPDIWASIILYWDNCPPSQVRANSLKPPYGVERIIFYWWWIAFRVLTEDGLCAYLHEYYWGSIALAVISFYIYLLLYNEYHEGTLTWIYLFEDFCRQFRQNKNIKMIETRIRLIFKKLRLKRKRFIRNWLSRLKDKIKK